MSKRIKRLTKVIATLGPASQGRLEEMIEAGVVSIFATMFFFLFHPFLCPNMLNFCH